MSWESPECSLIRDLVGCRSESGSEDECCALLVSRLPALGWEKVGRDGIGNVTASRGEGEKEILLLGHIDTVPGGPQFSVDGEVLWGRGAVDAKGPLAAFSVAGGRMAVPWGWKVSLVAAVGEERDSRGARYLVGGRKPPSACLIGEPSGGDGVTLAYRGCLFAEISSMDDGAHRSGDSGPLTAVLMAAADSVSSVESMNEEGLPIINRFSGAVASMIGSEEGSRFAKVGLDIRLPLGADPMEIGSLLRDICGRRSVGFEVIQQVPAHGSPRGDRVVAALSSSVRELGRSPRLLAKGGTADFNVVAPWGVPMAAYGPGDSTLDHGPCERLSKVDFLFSMDVLDRALPKICILLDR